MSTAAPNHYPSYPNPAVRLCGGAQVAGMILASALSVTAAAAEPRGNDDFIEELVVTAEFGAPVLYATPNSVSVIRPGDARQTLTNHLEEVLGWVPNLNLASGGSRARFVQIRGIGERGQFVEPLNASVGVLVDGVDLSGIGTAASLYGIDQVEVLRGPQGTLYGANALAGLIVMRSERPEPEWRTRIDLDAGDYNARGIGVVTGGALGSRTRARFVTRQYEDDGFIDNRFLGRDDTDRHDELTLRGSLFFDLEAAGELDLHLGHIDIDNGYDAFSLENDRNTRSDEPGRDQQETTYLSLAYRSQSFGNQRLEATFGALRSDNRYGYDEDWTFVGFHPFEYSSTDLYERERRNLTLDLRLLSDQPLQLGGLDVDWVAGLYYLTQETELDRTYTFAGPFDSRFEIDRIAAYGEVVSYLGDRTRVRAGLRLEQHRADYVDSAFVRFDPVDDLWGGRLVVERDLANGALLYGAVTRGYKAGGFNTDGTLDADLRQFDPEALWNIEAGLKGRFLDDRLGLRASLFWMIRPDIQVNTSITRLRDNGSSEFIDYIDNAADGRNIGTEIELDYRVNERLEVFASLGLLDTELEDYINGAGDDLDGREQSQAPGYTFFAGVEFFPARGWFLRAELEGKDSFFTSDSHSVRAPAYELINLSAGYAADRWRVRVWGRNLTDETVVVRGFFFPNDPRTGYDPAQAYTQLGEPRRVGVTLSVDI
ncbi:MAG: TonB-dependent receptor plug domain-containing protein [Pseudomonadota bacterium]